jgi:hypothetical protein
MVMLMVEIDEHLMERLQAKAVAEDKPLQEVVIAGLEKTALHEEVVPENESGHDLLLKLADLAGRFEPLVDRDDISENFDEIMDMWMEEDLRKKEQDQES